MSDHILVPDPNSLEGRVAGFTEIGLMGHDSDEVSDGWHTFGDLYRYRMLYNAGMALYLYEFFEEHGPYDDHR